MDLTSNYTINSHVDVDDIVHTFGNQNIFSTELSFVTSTQDFKLSNKNNRKYMSLLNIDTLTKQIKATEVVVYPARFPFLTQAA